MWPRLRTLPLARAAAPALTGAVIAAAMPLLKRLAAPLLVGTAALLLASAARYGLIEPQAQAAACDPEPWRVGCALRSLVIEAFIHQRLAWLALALALLATGLRSGALALAALAAGAAALVLYSAGLAAPAVLLALLVWVRPRAAP